jgi:hypothetical protein
MPIAFIRAGTLAVLTAHRRLSPSHEVAIVDKGVAGIETVSDTIDCGFLHGDGLRLAVLRDADPRETDFLFCDRDHHSRSQHRSPSGGHGRRPGPHGSGLADQGTRSSILVCGRAQGRGPFVGVELLASDSSGRLARGGADAGSPLYRPSGVDRAFAWIVGLSGSGGVRGRCVFAAPLAGAALETTREMEQFLSYGMKPGWPPGSPPGRPR